MPSKLRFADNTNVLHNKNVFLFLGVDNCTHCWFVYRGILVLHKVHGLWTLPTCQTHPAHNLSNCRKGIENQLWKRVWYQVIKIEHSKSKASSCSSSFHRVWDSRRCQTMKPLHSMWNALKLEPQTSTRLLIDGMLVLEIHSMKFQFQQGKGSSWWDWWKSDKSFTQNLQFSIRLWETST